MSRPAPESAAPARGDYAYLEGLRGLAALYVVFFHVWQGCVLGSPQSTAVDLGLGWAAGGIPAVAVFITLSGFLLGLPVARAGELAGGVAGFARRRARRILPPYLAALALSAAFEGYALPVAQQWALGPDPAPAPVGREGEIDGGGAEAFPTAARNLAAHAALVHNLRPETIYAINGPLWSVATECQIYAAFALALVPLRRAAGPGAALAAGAALGGLAWLAEPAVPPGACLWLVGCFALGAAAAEVAGGRWQHLLARGPWRGCALLALAGVAWVPLQAACHVYWAEAMIVPAAFAALATCALILAARRGDGWAVRLARRLAGRGPARLGAMSYSLYLTHGPLVGAADALLRRADFAPAERLPLMVGAAVPACLAVAWGFHRAFERPTLAPRRPAP